MSVLESCSIVHYLPENGSKRRLLLFIMRIVRAVHKK